MFCDGSRFKVAQLERERERDEARRAFDAALERNIKLEADNAKLRAEVEQLQVQLAGCSVAALGWDKEPCKQGDYGWSASYGDVVKLRARLATAEAVCEAAQDGPVSLNVREALARWREGR